MCTELRAVGPEEAGLLLIWRQNLLFLSGYLLVLETMTSSSPWSKLADLKVSDQLLFLP